MTEIQGKNILITGGASGIGRLMGLYALEKKAKHLIIWDINPLNLEKTLKEFQKKNFSVSGHIIDVRDTSKIKEVMKEVFNTIGPVDILINNAGVVVGKDFDLHQHEEIDKTMAINTTSLMHISLEALSQMKDLKEAHIVNIASAAGMVSNPKMSVYCASKWAVIGWSDSLRLEMKNQYPHIKITTVCPYYIDTGMFSGVKSPIIPILKPIPTAKRILKAIEKNKVFLRMPWLIALLPLIQGLLPYRLFDLIVGKWFGVYKSMEEFKGRNQSSSSSSS